MKTARLALLLLGMSACLILAGCATYRLQKQLDPESREFLSKVRYIITKEERATFVRLPAEERKPFVEAFWKKRDPDPETEENEFKEAYFKRIEEANRLFGEGGGSEPGWLQDRGRLYILIGPPDHRETYPRGVTFYGVPTEIWYYGWFPILFVDPNWNGNYKLEPASAIQLAEIMSTQMRLKPWVAPEKGALEVDFKAEGKAGGAIARLAVPYRKIWFASRGEMLRTTLEAAFEVTDAAGKKVADIRKDIPVELTEAKLEEVIRTDFVVEIPLDLKPGSYWVALTLANGADESRVHKKLKLSF
jgi:GWxTD domain-containing protein